MAPTVPPGKENHSPAALTTAERVKTLGVDLKLESLEEAERRTYEACGLPVGSSPDIPG